RQVDMLKLEKPTFWGPIQVSVRHRDRLLTPAFLFALCLAICIHLVGLIVFHVKPYYVLDAARVFPPVTVSIDFGKSKDGMIEAHFYDNSRQSIYSFELPIPSLVYPTLPPISSSKIVLEAIEYPIRKDPFRQIVLDAASDD